MTKEQAFSIIGGARLGSSSPPKSMPMTSSISSDRQIEVKMSIKYISCIPVWIFSPAILGDVSVEHEERFHLDLIIATMRNDTRVCGAPVCGLIARLLDMDESLNIAYKT